MLENEQNEDDEDIVFEKDDDLKEAESKIGELLKEKERTPEQEEELKELKTKRQNRYNERLRELTQQRRKEAERAARAEAKAEELLKKLEEKSPQPSAKTMHREQIAINGKSFFTDRALSQMVQAGEMTQDDAWQHQQERIEEKAVSRLKTERQQDDQRRQQEEDIKWVLGKYPKFNPQHPNHNPNDPIYKEANRLIDKGYRSLRSAVEDAEEKIGKNNQRPDLSDDLSVAQSGGSETKRSKTVELSDYETENAVRFYVFGGRTNPSTGKIYTEAEAIQKAMKAKQERQALSTTKR
jgi:hypothetical protein